MQVPFQIEVGCNTILGILHIPAKRAPGSPVVFMSYGLNGNRVDNNRISVAFGRKAEESGIIFCRFDYRGLGVSEKDFWEISMTTKIEDSLAVIEFLKGCMQAEKHSLFILGFSDGLRIAVPLLKHDIDVSGLILWSPIFFIETKYVDSSIPKKFEREPVSKEVVFPFKGLWINQKHLRQQVVLGTEYEDFRKFSKPKLSVFGGNDPATLATFKQINNGVSDIHGAKNIMIPDADHLYSGSKWTQQLITETVNWVKDVSEGSIDK